MAPGGRERRGDEGGDGPSRSRDQLKLLAAWRDGAGLSAFARFGPGAPRLLQAATAAIADQIEGGVVEATAEAAFRAYCNRTLDIHASLIELAQICKQGGQSGWPSAEEATNADAWQNTYEKLAARISDGRVDADRPLKPLARLTAKRLFLSDLRRQRRLSALSATQLHRFNLGEETPPEERAERARGGAALRAGCKRLQAEGRLSGEEAEILRRRYVEEWSSGEVAAAMDTTAANVRQVCARRRGLIRAELSGQDLEESAAT